MKFRRCKVAPVGGVSSPSMPRHAWVPVDRAFDGSVVSLEFPMQDARDFAVVECDTLVIDGRDLPYVADEPTGSAHR